MSDLTGRFLDMNSDRDNVDDLIRPMARLLALTSPQRLHLIQGSPWKPALGAFMADGPDEGYWSAPMDYARGDLLLTVLNTEPRMLLCLERASIGRRGKFIEVEHGRVTFHPLVAVCEVEQLAEVTLPQAPATLSEFEARALLAALEIVMNTPTTAWESESKRTPSSRCKIPTGSQAAALLVADGRCGACGRDFGHLFGGQGIAGLEVHQRREEELVAAGLYSREKRLAVMCGGCHLLVHAVGSPSVESVKFAWWPGCPRCGIHPPNEILWGMPIWPVNDPHVTIGGCIVEEHAPRWHCTSCEHRWGSWLD
jgi:hypothetical protein